MTKQEKLDELFSRNHFLPVSAVRAAGIQSQFITNMLRTGKIVRVARGIYSRSGSTASETDDLELLARRIPAGVICLVSALRFHKLTDENPHKVSIALPHGYHTPELSYPSVRYFSFSGEAFSKAIEPHMLNGTTVKVYSVEKTIVDCFKYRNKVGLDIAVAALREAANQNRIDYNSLWESAKICRVSNIIRPYVEACQ
ncbi:MAG: hypothetical protein MJ025_05200 [Victivallaceae bacterium]|nr:hypothetical protein [Victivallaceae bacterium]